MAVDLKHTPGPWTSAPMFDTDDSDPPEIRDQVLITAGEDLYVAETRQNNARLIAAAPEMLEALQTLLEYEPELRKNRMQFETAQEDWAKARAALARARGEL